MPKKDFDPYTYKNKNIINVATTGVPGVLRIFTWSKRKNRYIPKTLGNKYYSTKRIAGKPKHKCFKTMEEAKTWKVNPESQLKVRDNEGLLFSQVQEMFIEKKKTDIKPSTFETLKRKCKHLDYFHSFTVREVTPRHIDAWLVNMKSEKALKMQHKARVHFRHELSALRQILVYYSEYLSDLAFASPLKQRHGKDCYVDKVKYKEKKAREKKKFLSSSEISSFLNTMKSMFFDKAPLGEAYCMLSLFQMRTGTRIGEAAGVHWEDICLVKGLVNINRNVCWSRGNKNMPTYISGTTKNGLSRVVPLHKELVSALKAWQLKVGRSRGLLFSVDSRGGVPFGIQEHCL